jgi:hypothetical protein
VRASAIAHHVEASAAIGDEQAIGLLTEARKVSRPRPSSAVVAQAGRE